MLSVVKGFEFLPLDIIFSMGENIRVEDIVRNALAESKRLEKVNAMRDENAKLKAASGGKPADEKEEVETFECPECGAKVTANQKFCNRCGIALEWEE